MGRTLIPSSLNASFKPTDYIWEFIISTYIPIPTYIQSDLGKFDASSYILGGEVQLLIMQDFAYERHTRYV